MRMWSSLIFSTLVLLGASAAAAPPGPEPRAPGDQLAPVTPAPVSLSQRFGPDVKVTWNASRTAPRRLAGLSVATTGPNMGERARGFLLANAALFGLEGDLEIQDVRVFAPPDAHARRPGTKASFHTVRLTQLWNGLPVEGRSVVVRMDDDGRVTSVASDLGPLLVPRPTRVLDPASVSAMVMATYRITAMNVPEQVVLTLGNGGRVAWKVGVAVLPLQAQFFVWVDAETGRVLREAPAAFDQTMRELPMRAGEVTP